MENQSRPRPGPPPGFTQLNKDQPPDTQQRTTTQVKMVYTVNQLNFATALISRISLKFCLLSLKKGQTREIF